MDLDLNKLSQRQRERLRRATAVDSGPLNRMFLAPWRVMESPDPWQKDLLSQLITRQEDSLVLCSRGAGKTRCVASATYLEACLGGIGMVISRSDRQAKRVIRYAMRDHLRLGLSPLVRKTSHELEFASGGQIVAFPCREDTIRGEHEVTLLVVDEGSRVPDEVFASVTPMVETVGGTVVVMTTPWGKRGFFYNEWTTGDGWRRHRYSWRDCPRLRASTVEKARRRHGDAWARQEYLDCEAGDEFLAIAGGVFDVSAFEALVDLNMQPLEV